MLRITGELADFAETTIADATRVLGNTRRHLSTYPDTATRGLTALTDSLSTAIERASQVLTQTRIRLTGELPPAATRLVSMHDPDARPIAKGRLGKPVEFGYKAQVIDNQDGIVLDHSLHVGNPADAPLLVPAIKRVAARLGTAPAAVTADRGYGQAAIEGDLTDAGVRTVAIPRKGKPSQHRREVEKGLRFQRLVKWRTGCEGRISYLKHRFGWDRTLFDGHDGAQTWCGLGVFAHNGIKIADLLASHTAGPTNPAVTSRRPDETGAGPPGAPDTPAA